MEPVELEMAVSRLLLRINIITGWPLYEDPTDQRELENQFRLKLQENYGNTNLDEIEAAFRNNTSVKDWGKNINLAMIDEVMIPYLDQRREVSKLEEQMMNKKELPALPTEQLTEDEILDISRQTFKITGLWQLVQISAYKILKKRGLLNFTEEEKKGIRLQAKLKIEEMFKDDPNLFTNSSRESWEDMYAKRIAASRYFLNEKQ